MKVGKCPVCQEEKPLTFEHYVSMSVALRFLKELIPINNKQDFEKMRVKAKTLRAMCGGAWLCQPCNYDQEKWKINVVNKIKTQWFKQKEVKNV